MNPDWYDSTQIIPNWEVEVWCFEDSDDMERFMNQFKPTDIVLLDPQLQYLRCIEIYNARTSSKKMRENNDDVCSILPNNL